MSVCLSVNQGSPDISIACSSRTFLCENFPDIYLDNFLNIYWDSSFSGTCTFCTFPGNSPKESPTFSYKFPFLVIFPNSFLSQIFSCTFTQTFPQKIPQTFFPDNFLRLSPAQFPGHFPACPTRWTFPIQKSLGHLPRKHLCQLNVTADGLYLFFFNHYRRRFSFIRLLRLVYLRLIFSLVLCKPLQQSRRQVGCMP